MSRVARNNNNALFVAKREFVSLSVRQFLKNSFPSFYSFLLLLLNKGSIRIRSQKTHKKRSPSFYLLLSNNFIRQTNKQTNKAKKNKREEDKAQRSEESRDSKEGSMSPIDLSKFTDEEYIAPPHHKEELHNDHIHQRGGEQQQASEDAMDWLDQATNTTHYFADPLDTFMQNFQNANAGAGGSSEDADYGGVQAHETHFSLDSRIFENDSQPGIAKEKDVDGLKTDHVTS